jgi:hypothetical protein
MSLLGPYFGARRIPGLLGLELPFAERQYDPASFGPSPVQPTWLGTATVPVGMMGPQTSPLWPTESASLGPSMPDAALADAWHQQFYANLLRDMSDAKSKLASSAPRAPSVSDRIGRAIAETWDNPPSGPSLIGMAKSIWEGLKAPSDILAGNLHLPPPGVRRQDFTDIPGPAQPHDEAIRRSTDLAGLLMSSTLAAPRGAFATGASRPPKPPLPLDEASRMARAREMGFDLGTPVYKGVASPGRIEWLDPALRGSVHDDPRSKVGSWAALDRDDARGFAIAAENRFGSPGQVLELFYRAQKRGELDVAPRERPLDVAERIRDAWKKGYDALLVRARTDSGEARVFVAVKDENQFRSKYAVFDPARRDENDLFAGVGTILPLPVVWPVLGETPGGSRQGSVRDTP